jgi:hypothetical protein
MLHLQDLRPVSCVKEAHIRAAVHPLAWSVQRVIGAVLEVMNQSLAHLANILRLDSNFAFLAHLELSLNQQRLLAQNALMGIAVRMVNQRLAVLQVRSLQATQQHAFNALEENIQIFQDLLCV